MYGSFAVMIRMQYGEEITNNTEMTQDNAARTHMVTTA
jgi:hypothetical protein